MKKSRLLLITILSVFCLSALTMSVPAEQQEYAHTETYEAMKAMGLLTDEFLNINSGSSVTRAQFMGALYKLTGAPETASGISLPFEDVTAATPHREAIAYFYSIGAVSGAGNSSFEPDEKITYTQAVKVICDFLGYRLYIQQSLGAYPGGYLAMAAKLNLAKGIDLVGADAPMNAESVVAFLYNAANSPVGEAAGYNENGEVVSHTMSKDTTLLSLYNNIYYSEGVLSNNGVVSLEGGTVTDGTITFDGKKYKASGFDFTEYLGIELSFFYKSSLSEDTVLWAYPTSDNSVITLSADDLIKDDDAYSTSRIVYYKNDRRKTLDIDDLADIVYNNTLTNSATVDYLKPECGEIRLIDNNGDNDYDIVIVKDYRNIFVSAVSVEKEFITDRYGETVDLSVYNHVKVFNDRGESISFDEVASDRVVSYLASPDSNEYIYLYVNSPAKKAVLDSVSDADEKIYTFEGVDFLMSQSLSDVISEGRYYVPQLKVGQSYMFYLDITGKIAAVKNASETEQYAYFIAAKPNSDSFADEGCYKIKLLTSNGITAVVTTSKNFKLIGYNDGIPLEQKEPQTVKVLFDAEGCIKELRFATPLDKEQYTNGLNKNDFTLDYSPVSAYYRNKIFDGSYSIDGTTLIFATMLGYDGEVTYEVVGVSSLLEEQTYGIINYNGETYSAPRLYDADEYMHINVMDITLRMGNFVNNDVNILVDEVRRCIDENGNESLKVICLMKGEQRELKVESPALLPSDGLKRGDVARAAIIGNKVYRIVKVFSLNNPEQPFIDTTEGAGATVGHSIAYGYLFSNDGVNISLYKPDGWNNGNNVLVSAIRITENMFAAAYDTKTDKVYLTSINDIYQNCVPDADGTLNVDGRSTKVFISRKLGYITSLFAVYY